ncbi:molybdopterin converting factor subunit 1 [soil metagenome]|nr:molybdopterin converting factor subunit 1 [Acidobacteriota bacterium]
MLVTIRLFARLREIAGAADVRRELPDGATAASAWEALAADFEQLGPYRATISCAVNEEYARLTTPLKDGDEVAFLPPVSGGDSRVLQGAAG